jgi:hypothetical protein
MKKVLPIVLVVIVVGIVGFFLMNRGGEGMSIDKTPAGLNEGETFTGSLIDAVKLGVAMKCTYEVEGNEYEGYVKGTNYRGKMTTVEGKVMEVIVKDNCMWSWSEEENQGIKTCFEETEMETEEGGIWEQSGASVDINYRCVPTAVTDAQFTPPANIEFMDIDSMMEDLRNQMSY